LGCETDFVAKNEIFDDLMNRVLEVAIGHDAWSFEQLPETTREQINEIVAEVIGKLGENMKVVELFVKKLPSSEMYAYTHA
jgi:translation elongation factor EF-Ts